MFLLRITSIDLLLICSGFTYRPLVDVLHLLKHISSMKFVWYNMYKCTISTEVNYSCKTDTHLKYFKVNI